MSRISLNNDIDGSISESRPLLTNYTAFPNVESTPTRKTSNRLSAKSCPTCKGTGKVDRGLFDLKLSLQNIRSFQFCFCST